MRLALEASKEAMEDMKAAKKTSAATIKRPKSRTPANDPDAIDSPATDVKQKSVEVTDA